jgi:hypothetical protein
MLTGFQVATGAYQTEDGEVLCEGCFDRGDAYCRPVSNYALDEWQSAAAEDGYCALTGEHWGNDDCGCEPPLFCDGCSAELRPAWEDTYFHEREEE